MPETDIYLKVRGEIKGEVGENLTLDKFAETIAADIWQERIANLPIVTLNDSMDDMQVISVMSLIQRILQEVPEARLHIFGAEETLIKIVKNAEKNSKPHIFWVILICLLLFIGSALAIMNFHDDVNMAGAHKQIYFLLTGKREEHPLLLQIPYSLGIGMGMMIFFGFFSKKSREKDPSPLELEIHNYEQQVHDYVLHRKQQKEKEKE
ncbi:MAG: stage V sporulation protein AA [bacterium]